MRSIFFIVLMCIIKINCNHNDVQQITEQCVIHNFKGSSCDFKIVFETARVWLHTQQKMSTEDDIKTIVAYMTQLNYGHRRHDDVINTTKMLLQRYSKLDKVTGAVQNVGVSLFRAFANIIINHAPRDNMQFMDLLTWTELFYNSYPIWTSSNYRYINIALQTYRHLRNMKPLAATRIDDAAWRLMHMSLHYPINYFDVTYLKQTMYMQYVIYLKLGERNRFNGLYFIVDKTNLLPKTTVCNITGSMLSFRVYHNIVDNDTSLIVKTIREGYTKYVDYYLRLNTGTKLIFFQPRINLHVFNTRDLYVDYSALFNYDPNSGGSTSYDIDTINVYTYFDNNPIPYSLSHEINHALLFSSSTSSIDSYPMWYIEGLADSIGQPECYYKSITYYKNLNNSTVPIKNILIANYNVYKNILYSMGAGLVNFFYNYNITILKEINVNKNYEIRPDAHMQSQFDNYIRNQIQQCDTTTDGQPSQDVQTLYVRDLNRNNFGYCWQGISVEFNDCLFVLTSNKLYRIIKYAGSLSNADIVTDLVKQTEVTAYYDYEWLKTRLANYTLYYYVDQMHIPYFEAKKDRYFEYNLEIEPRPIIQCLNNNQLHVQHYIMKFAERTDMFKKLTQCSSILTLRKKLKVIKEKYQLCKRFIRPLVPITNINNNVYTLARNISLFNTLKTPISSSYMTQIIDTNNNTLEHALALYAKSVYRHYTTHSMLRNNIYNLPTDLYRIHYRHYCQQYKFIKPHLVAAPSISQPNFSSTTTISTIKSTTTVKSNIFKPNVALPPALHIALVICVPVLIMSIIVVYYMKRMKAKKMSQNEQASKTEKLPMMYY